MKAEKIHLIEYQCPSCGADLHYREDQFMITCQYCGARVERELDRSAQDKVYAQQCLNTVKQYRRDMDKLHMLEKNRESAKERVKLCSSNVLAEPSFIERVPYLPIVIALPIAVIAVIASKGERSLLALMGLILAAAAIVCAVSAARGKQKRQIAAQARGRIDDAQKALVRAGNELEAFERSFDKKPIPKQYRSDELLQYLQHVFETAQACSMGEGFKLCDDYIAHRRLEDMKREQLARVMLLSQSMKSERESSKVSSDGVRLMKRGTFAEIMMAKKTAASEKDSGGELMMALAKATARSDSLPPIKKR